MKSKRLITPEFRAFYARLLTPGVTLNGEEKYSISMVFPKSTNLVDLKKAVTQVLIDKFGPDQKKWPQIRSPFRDGDEKDDPNYKGSVFVNCSSTEQPQVVNTRLEQLTMPEEVYSGMYARASITPFYYDKSGNKGVSFGLNNVMKTKDGERLDGRTNAEEDFKDFSEPVDDLTTSIFD